MITDYRNKNLIPFNYDVQITLLASASGTVNLTLASDSVFELHRILASTSLDLNTDVNSNRFTVLISDQSTGRQLSNARIPQRILCPATYPILQPRPVQFPPNAIMQFDFTNLIASTIVIDLVFNGYKIFNP